MEIGMEDLDAERSVEPGFHDGTDQGGEIERPLPGQLALEGRRGPRACGGGWPVAELDGDDRSCRERAHVIRSATRVVQVPRIEQHATVCRAGGSHDGSRGGQVLERGELRHELQGGYESVSR